MGGLCLVGVHPPPAVRALPPFYRSLRQQPHGEKDPLWPTGYTRLPRVCFHPAASFPPIQTGFGERPAMRVSRLTNHRKIGTDPIFIFIGVALIICYYGIMPRSARVVIEGCAHHVTQRGNNHQDVFFVDDDQEPLARLRLCTSRGRPLGSDNFVAKLETVLGRRLRPLPRGRPAKNRVRPY